MRHYYRKIVPVLLFLSCSIPGATIAQTLVEHYEKGRDYFEKGEYEQAFESLSDAVDPDQLSGEHVFGVNCFLAFTAFKLKKDEQEVIKYVAAAIVANPDGNASDLTTERELVRMYTRYWQKLTGSLYLVSEPAGASVSIARPGSLRFLTAKTPAVIPNLSLGTHEIVVQIDGYMQERLNYQPQPLATDTMLVSLKPVKKISRWPIAVGALIVGGATGMIVNKVRGTNKGVDLPIPPVHPENSN